MNFLQSDFDEQIVTLEHEWRQVYEATLTARANYQALLQHGSAQSTLLAVARERLECAEQSTAQTMEKIERLERRVERFRPYL